MQPNCAHVSRETLGQLEQYAELLAKWNRKINLVAPSTLEQLWERHIWDSYQLVEHIPPNATIHDLGSGGGLPGLVIAIARPDCPITLIERDQRKAAFLNQVALTLGLRHVRVVNSDITDVTSQADIVTARALATLDTLCALAHPLLLNDAICLFPKGENFATEVVTAKTAWDFTHTNIASKTHDSACIISISKLKPRS